MSFNFNQYIKDTNAIYYEQVNPPAFSIETGRQQYQYKNLSMKKGETYAIVLYINSLLKEDNKEYNGTISISQNNSNTSIIVQNFIIPTIIPQKTISKTIEEVIENYESSSPASYWNDIKIGEYLCVKDELATRIYKRISFNSLFLSSFEFIGTTTSQEGFLEGRKKIEKIMTIKGNHTYDTLSIDFTTGTGIDFQLYKMQELMGNSNFIPYSKIKHMGIQGKSGMQYCVNGNELIMTSREVEEFYSFNENNPISSIKVFPKEDDFFFIDYEYIQ